VKADRGSKRLIDNPIDLPRGREFVTLNDAAGYIAKLKKAEQKLEEWQTATEVLMMAAEGRPADACADRHAVGDQPERRARVQSRSQRRALREAEAETG
jgi:hypothetical protein